MRHVVTAVKVRKDEIRRPNDDMTVSDRSQNERHSDFVLALQDGFFGRAQVIIFFIFCFILRNLLTQCCLVNFDS